jgi:hypothetical protein
VRCDRAGGEEATEREGTAMRMIVLVESLTLDGVMKASSISNAILGEDTAAPTPVETQRKERIDWIRPLPRGRKI